MNLSQAKPTPKQLNLNKLGDAGGFQIHWPATLSLRPVRIAQRIQPE